MTLSRRQRQLIRLAHKARDPELRRRAVAQVRLETQQAQETFDAELGDTSMTPFARRMVRLAYMTGDPVLRHGILESMRVAGYPKEFLDHVKTQTFHNPDTDNKVQFVSLPGREQAQVYQKWKGAQTPDLSGMTVSKEVQQDARDRVYSFLPTRVRSFGEMKQAHKAGKPWRLTATKETASGGKFWEIRGDGDQIQVRFGPLDGWRQNKEFTGTIEEAWGRAQKKLAKGYEDDVGFKESMALSGGPMGLSAAKLWDQIEKKYGDDPTEMAAALQATLKSLSQLDSYQPGDWDSVHKAYDGLVKKWKAAAAKADAPEAEAPKPEKPEKAEAPKPEKPEKAEAPKPKGKHKDRKELRAKAKKKMSDSVTVSDELAAILISDSMSDTKKDQAKQQLKAANFQLLSTLRENAYHALQNPNGAYAKALKKTGYSPEGIRKMHTSLSQALAPALGKKYHPDVLMVANQYDLESEDADDLAAFKGNRPSRGKKLTPQELFQKFMAKAKPETKERMQGMAMDDFMAMYKSILSDEDEEIETGTGKTAARLPEEPHNVMQDALEEGILAGDENEGDANPLTIFDDPSVKKAELSEEDLTLVRLAHSTADPQLRRRVLAMIRPTA